MVLPMLASPIRKIEDLQKYANNANYLLEEKYDGERMLVYIGLNQPPHQAGYYQKCYSRMLKLHTNFKHQVHFNDSVRVENCILDGELVYLNSLDELVPICDTGNRLALKQRFYIFDIQMLNNVNVTMLDLHARKNLLNTVIKPTNHCQLSPYKSMEYITREMLLNEFNTVCRDGGEGLMLKNTKISYLTNVRKYWHKVKSLHLRDFMEEYDLYAHRFLRDKNNIYNILECGYYESDTGEFKQVARVSSGINNNNRMRLRLMLKLNTKQDREQQHYPDSPFQSRVIVTIVADKITNNGHLRHPIFKRIRTDLTTIDVSQFTQYK